MRAMQRAGKDFDNDVANELESRTDESVKTHSMRGSGNTLHPQPDVLIRRNHHDVALELKRTSVATGEHFYIEKEDLEQLAHCRNELTHAYLGVKFTYRELLVVWMPQHASVSNVAEKMAENVPEAFKPHITPAGNLRLTKPPSGSQSASETWPSTKKGDGDIEVIANELNIELTEEKE